MLACRLCLAFGVQDPEQWLEDCPQRVLNIWRAYWQLEPWGTERRLLSEIVASMRQNVAVKYAKDLRSDVLAAISNVAALYMPADWIEQPEDKQELDDIAQAEAKIRVLYGNNN